MPPERRATRRLIAAMAPRAAVAVAFHLPSIRTVADDDQIRGMYFLGKDVDLDSIEAIAMAPGGAAMLKRDGTIELPPACPQADGGPQTLLDVHQRDLEELQALGDLCVGVGRLPGLPPAALALNLEDGFARGAAILRSMPQGEGLDLLPAIGVRIIGCSPLSDGRVRIELENRLAAHFDAARLSDYRRTSHCNRFFLEQGRAVGDLADGLLAAARARIAAGRRRIAGEVVRLGRRALAEGLSLHVRAPGRETTTPFGNLVPLGPLGAALARVAASDLESASEAAVVLGEIRDHLETHRRSGGWGYSVGCISTSTDTALVALAGVDPDFQRIDEMRGPSGGFVPQRMADGTSDDASRGDAMRRTPATEHWEEEDVPTTALLESLRMDAGLEPRVDATWYLKRFSRWSGLYFTPPLLGVWTLARMLARLEPQLVEASDTGKDDDADGTEDAREGKMLSCRQLRATLHRVIKSHRRGGRGFGRFDPALHESLAVLALAELGHAGRTTLAAQLRWLDAWEHPTGVETPFHSTLAGPPARSFEELLSNQADSCISHLHGRPHAISTYEDPDRLVVAAFGCLALFIDAEEIAEPANGEDYAIETRLGSTATEQAFLAVEPYTAPRSTVGGDHTDPFVAPKALASPLKAMEFVIDRLGEHLVSAAARERVLQAVERTDPSHLKGSTFGLEFRLRPDDDTVDFLWCLSRHRRNLTALLNEPDSHSRFRHLARLWRTPSGGKPPIAYIDEIWFEHDLDDAAVDLPPAFFFGPSKLQTDSATRYLPADVAGNVRRVVDALLPDDPVRENLIATADTMERWDLDVEVFQTGLMFSRSTHPVRLCFTPKSCMDEIEGLLRRLDLGDRVLTVQSVLDALDGGRIAICVDVSAAGVHPRLGMECYSGPRPDQRSSIEWFRGAMNRLGEFGRIDDAKARDLLGITGWTSLGANGGVHRQLNHLKVIDSPGHPLEIKAYLALSLRVAPSFPGVAKESVRRAESA